MRVVAAPEVVMAWGSGAGRRAEWLSWLAPAAILVVYAVLVSRAAMTPTTPPPWPSWSFVDFRDTVWWPGRDLAAGNDPYQVAEYLIRHPYAQEFPLYAPAALVVTAPLAALPWPWAVAVCASMIAACHVLLAWWSVRQAGLTPRLPWAAAVMTVVLLSPPGNQGFMAGQLAVPTGTAALLAVGTSRGRLGALAAALTLLKPQVGVPVLAVLLVTGRWRRAAAGAGIAGLVSLPVMAWLAARAGGPAAWIEELRVNLSYSQRSPNTAATRVSSSRIDLIGSLERIGHEPGAGFTVLLTVLIALLTLAAAALAWRARQARRAGPERVLDDVRWWAAVAAALLCWTPNEAYAALVCVPAALCAVALALQTWRGRPGRLTLPGVLAALSGVLAAVPLVHVHRVDAVLGLPVAARAGNGVALIGAAVLAAWSARTALRTASSTD